MKPLKHVVSNPGASAVETMVRRTARCGMTDGTVMRIEFVSGFELFNDRPYHNYETWAQGWRVTGLGVTTNAESLDVAVAEWATLVRMRREGQDIWRGYLDVCDGLLPDWIVPQTQKEQGV